MAAIQIGKYKRPGIFIEEFDQSILPNLPAPTDALTTFVAGFSRKGPVNTPVLISNTDDLERIFGPLDRNLERKGSFFHRTVAKILESSPVLAMNLLSTSDTLDLVEYRSLSTATNKTNSAVREIPFRKVHDTSGFWKKDTDTFITTVSDEPSGADRLFHLTNLSNRYVSVFIFKSRLTGFNTPLIDYYGTADKVPTYVSPLDYASDYLLDVLVVGGDWSNYTELAVDPRWSAYFDSTGLLKSQVSTFAQDRNVNTLAFYEGVSLIPYFRDENGRNIFIETIINNETDRTGLFCAFNADKLEKDFPNGMVDIIGNNLAVNNSLIDIEQDTIDFLSYSETITEQNPYTLTPLDEAGGTLGQGVVALGPSISLMRSDDWYSYSARTAYNAEERIAGVRFAHELGGYTGSTATQSIVFSFVAGTVSMGSTTFSQPYFVVGGNKVLVSGGTASFTASVFTFSVSKSDYLATGSTQTFYSVIYLNSSTGNLEKTQGTIASDFPNVPGTSDLALGYLTYKIGTDGFISQVAADYPSYTPVGVTGSAIASSFVEIRNDSDYTVTNVSGGVIDVEFLNTAVTDSTDLYEAHRKIRLFNRLVSLLDSANKIQMTMIRDLGTKEKFSLANSTISNIVTSSSSNKSFRLTLGLDSTPTDIAAGNLIFYKIDNEFFTGAFGFETKNTVGGATVGVAGKYSSVYAAFENGTINTGDYFYENLTTKTLRVTFADDVNGDPVIVFNNSNPWAGITGTESVIIPNSVSNYKVFELDGAATFSIVDPITGTFFSGYGSSYVSYKLTDQTIVAEDITNVTQVWDASSKNYLRAFIDDTTNDINVLFTDTTLSSTQSVSQSLNKTITVISDLTNLKQSLEIHEPTGYTPVDNKVLVKGDRYKEVKVGDFLQAHVDVANLETGEVGRRLTRILNKRSWSVDPTYTEITCDARIQKYTFGTDMQTLRYVSIDSYVDTYKAIPLKGFRVREASMPDGTEATQTAILNLIAKGTQLFKALINKDAIDFRYVVDSFGLGLIENSKQQLVDLCGERLDCLGFVNMPSLRQFKNSTNPVFTDENGVLQTSFIAAGGDPEANAQFLYSFGTGKGVSSVGYFTPYLIVNDNGRPTELPPAMFAATTYLRKQLGIDTAVVPWTIAAGVTNGRITGIQGVEQNFSLEDIENLNLAQMNPIVFKRNRGFVIETENTAQTLYKSALSFLHVREVLIELERELSAMLLDYQWKFNTAEVRAEIKLKADVICEKYVNKNGLYNYFNKCDEENNTPDLIDRQIGVLDTYVEPIKGMGVIVNNITILRTGAIEAGGFA